MVGAVITVNDIIIGEGFHQKFGSHHAEINAINSVKNPELLKDATIYVSLEPCFHVGKTPPCVQAIMANQFKAINISVKDINPLTSGKSIKILRDHNHQVQDHILEEKGKELIRPFSINMRLQRPFILLKYAVSQDGFIGKKNEQIWLSNPFSKRLTHLWRSKFDAILVGGHTVRTDNPRLSTRYFNPIDPLRVVLTKSGNLPIDAHIFDKDNPPLIATTNHKLIIPESNADILKLDPSINYLSDLMKHLLAQKNIGTIIVEGGAETLQSFIDVDLWDEARVIKTPKLLGNGIPMPKLKNALLHEKYTLDTDEILVYRNRAH